MGHFRFGRAIALAAIGVLVFPSTLFAQAQPTIPGFGRPTHEELTQATNSGKDWITYGGSLRSSRFSTLNQVNTSNVQNLKGAWLTRLGSGLGSKYRFEADPLVIDGVMYIPTGNDDIFALDAKTGRKMWEYFSDIPQVNDLICCGWDNRGVAAGGGRIYTGQLDATVVGIDQNTGRIIWKTQLEDYREGYSITGATRYYDGLIFTGMSGGENGIQGRIYALDAATGREVWRFYTVPNPGEIGSETWPMNDPDPVKANIYKHGGATVWQAPAIDPELGMLYFSTGNAGPWDGALRPGDSLFTASIVALDYRTGQYRWHFQQVRHEIWDFDMPNPPALFDQVYNGVPRRGLVQAGKTGWLYFLDRSNGEPLIGMDYRPVPQEPRQITADTQPYPVGDAFVDQCPEPNPNFALSGCIFTPYWDIPVVLRPTASGGSNWHPTTYHEPTGYVFVTGLEQNLGLMINEHEFELGKRYTRVTTVPAIGSSIASTLTAMDSRTNKIVWQKRKAGDRNYGLMSTAGDLVFTGQVDGNMMAYNARTGDELWKFQVGWGISAPPMTYEVDGVQYIAVAAGGNRGGATTLDGDAVWAFSLQGEFDQVAAPPPIVTKVEVTGRIVAMGDTFAVPGTVGLDDRVFNGTLDMIDYDFVPRRVSVPNGTTVTWENKGAVIHTATDVRGQWDTGDVRGGASGSVAFPTAGTYTYVCSPHPWMIGQVIVT